MQVVLLERIEKLGQMGDIVTVKNGFARNYLLPQKKALRATKANLVQFEEGRVQLEADSLKLRGEAEDVAKKLDGSSYTLLRQASETGQLYGSVTSRDVAAAVTAGGTTVTKAQIILARPIKTLGLHDIEIKLHAEVKSTVSLNVARSEDEAQRQIKAEATEAVIPDAEAFFESEEAAQDARDALTEEEAEPKAEEQASRKAAPEPDEGDAVASEDSDDSQGEESKDS